MALLKPYVDKGAISINELDAIRKDLLYNFFTGWIIRWEMEDKKMNYSKEENLKELVFNEYKNEPYWNEYYRYYNKKKIIMNGKSFLKRIIGKE